MNIKKLQETRIVAKDGHFLPLVFADMTIPAAFMAAGAKSLQTEWDNRKKKFSPVPRLIPYHPVSSCVDDREIIINSTDDIRF